MVRLRYVFWVGVLFGLGMMLRHWPASDGEATSKSTETDGREVLDGREGETRPRASSSTGNWASAKRGDKPAMPLLNEEEEEGLAEERGFFPRPVEEWQGMLVRLEDMPVCEDHCSQPFACIDGQCAPCVKDSECEGSEACVLDHCIQKENIACTARGDCEADEFCVLSDYPEPDPVREIDPLTYRGNEGMVASCQPIAGGADPVPPDGLEDIPDPEREVDPLRDHLAELIGQE